MSDDDKSLEAMLRNAGGNYTLRTKAAVVREKFEAIEELRRKNVLFHHIHTRFVEATGVDMDLVTFIAYVWRERKARANKGRKGDLHRSAPMAPLDGSKTPPLEGAGKNDKPSKQGFTIDFEKSKPATFQRTERK